jgi:hypothetical protein
MTMISGGSWPEYTGVTLSATTACAVQITVQVFRQMGVNRTTTVSKYKNQQADNSLNHVDFSGFCGRLVVVAGC